MIVASAAKLQAMHEIALRKQRKLHDAASTTVEAVIYSLRERGQPALIEPDCERRLSELSAAQMRDVIERLDRLRSKHPAITDNLLLLLAAIS
jgi:hypothetical protein